MPLSRGAAVGSKPSPAAVLLAAALYFGAAKVGLSLAFVAQQVTVVWPPTGMALAILLLYGRRLWPGVMLGAFLANVTTDAPIAVAVGIAIGNTLEAVVGARLLERAGFRPALDRVRDVVLLIGGAALVSTAISSTVGVLSLCAGGVEPWNRFAALWSVWWLGDAMGDLVVAPLVLVWADEVRRGFAPRSAVDAFSFAAATGVVCSVVFLGRQTREYPLHYTIFPIVVWAALRSGQLGTSVSIAIASVLAITGTASSLGPLAMGTVHESLVMVQLFMAVVACTALVVGAAKAERDAAERARAADFRALQIGAERLRLALEARDELEDELRERAAQLVDADRRKDEFLAMLGHELRNPLAPLSASLELLGRGGADRERFLAMANRQVKHLVRLVDDLLDVSRITRGKIALRRESVAIADVIEQAIELTRPLIDAQRQTLSVAPPHEQLRVDGDRDRLVQALSNLLVNASNYTPFGGSIAVGAERVGSEVALRVRDSGVGIAADLLPRIFDPFVQGESTPDRPRGGLGIGLTLVRALVEMHSGKVEARSAGRGRGSEFTIWLPLSSAIGALEEPAVPVSTCTAPRLPLRILIVEDNADAAEGLKAILESEGYHVRVAGDAVEGLEIAPSFAPDVVLSDIGLPGVDGYELAERLRASPSSSAALLVAISGYGREEDKQRAASAGFDEHFIKPLDLERLRSLLRRVGAAAA